MQQYPINVIPRRLMQFAGNMPGNGFTFAIWVWRQEDTFGLFRLRTELLEDFVFASDGDIFRGEIVGNVNAKTLFG
jgi:hypothetical protein